MTSKTVDQSQSRSLVRSWFPSGRLRSLFELNSLVGFLSGAFLVLFSPFVLAQSVDQSLTVQQLQDAAVMARLSTAVYDLSKKELQGGWKLIDFRDDLDGFRAGVYERTLDSGRVERVISFAGTRDIRDAATDISQGLPVPMGLWDKVFTQDKVNKALDFARQYTEAKDKNANVSISFTGHSLGGMYAQVCSLRFGERATVFNSAAVAKADWIPGPAVRENAPSLITQFVLDGDFVHDPTRALPGARQYGREYRIELPQELRIGILPSLFIDHGMEAFQVALESAYNGKPGGFAGGGGGSVGGGGRSTPAAAKAKENQSFWYQQAEIRERYAVPREGAELLAEQLLALANGLKELDKVAADHKLVEALMKNPVFKEAIKDPHDLSNAGDWASKVYNVYDAVLKDVKYFHDKPGVAEYPWVLLHSDTMDKVAEIVLDKAALPWAYEHWAGSKVKGTPTFGVVDLTRAVASHWGRGYADIDTVDKYMDSLVGGTWGALGFVAFGGNLKMAEVTQDFGLALAHTGRSAFEASGATAALSEQYARGNMRQFGLFGDWLRGGGNHAEQMLAMYRVLLARDASNGTQSRSISKMFTPELLKANGFTDRDRQRADEMQAKVAQIQSRPVKSISVPTDGKSFGSMGQNAQFAADLAQGNQKVVIFGYGPLADSVYQRVSGRVGADNVKLLPDIRDTFARNTIVSDFGAETTIRVTQEHYREITQNGYRQRLELTEPAPSIRSTEPPLARNSEPPRPVVPDIKPSASGYTSPHVGGVMLQGAAEMGDPDSPLTSGNFSLIFQGSNSDIDIPTLRRFVTALWAVYFTNNGPGISIDPIGSFTDRHAVRYIGRVVNSDLGRVMRETDYQMKSWAVGTSRPDIPNWSTPEEIGIRNGTVHVGAPSRFWFVPEKMQFSKADNALLFDSGMMRVKTEYLFSGKGEKNPENEEWAEQFTKRYSEISQHYPVFDELFEYAKLVSLAKYLKERRVPLLWFLLANREMVLTEDSPGTVKAFAKKSDYIEEIQIAGGVDLSPGLSADSYVADAELLKALAEARRNSPSLGATESRSSPPPVEIVQRANESLTVTPSQSVVISDSQSAEDAFATDLGVRLDGSPNLEIARYRRPDLAQVETFGRDWHLMIPYAIKPGSERRRSFAGARVPETMTLQNLLTGREESLHFDTDRYGIAGYIPENPETALNIGLFFLSDRTFRLVDKLGCELQFDESGRLTDMILAPNYHVRYEYAQKKINWRNFDPLPFRLEPEGTDRVPVQNVAVPKQLRLFDSATGKEEVFAFDTDNPSKKARYVSLNIDPSENSFISLMTDGSFVLKQKCGTEIAFDAGGRFSFMVAEVLAKMIQEPYEVRFEYGVALGQYRMIAARVFDQKADKVLHEVAYEYSPNGNLAGALVASAK